MSYFVSLEFQNDHLVVAIARSSGRRMQIERIANLELSEAQAGDAGLELKKFLTENRVAKAEGIGVVARRDTEMRIVEVPPAPDAELPDMVRFKARSDFGAFNDNWALDFLPFSDDQTKSRDILAMAIPPETVKRFEKLCEVAGLKLKHIVSRPYATVDLLRSKLLDQEVRLIVDESDEEWNLTVTRGCQILVTRSVKTVGERGSEEAAKRLAQNAKRTVASVAKMMGGEQLKSVIVCGDANGYCQTLNDTFAVDCETVDPLQLVPLHTRMERPKATSQITGVLGALLQHDSGLGHDIDFLNPRKVVVKEFNYRRAAILGGSAAAALIGLCLIGWWVLSAQTAEIANLQMRLDKAIAENNGYKGDMQVGPSSDQIIGEVGVIDQWKASDVNWLDELSEISARFMTPDDVIVDSFEASLRRNDPSIRVEGRIASPNKDKELKNVLMDRPYVVISPKSTPTEDDTYAQSFEYTLAPEVKLNETVKEMDARTREYIQMLREKFNSQSGGGAGQTSGESNASTEST